MRKEEGFVLINTIILSLIALIMLLGLVMLIYYGHRLSGMGKRYTSALEAAKGGALECAAALNNCTLDNNTFKCEHPTDTWEAYTATPLADLTSHTSPADIVNFPDWQRDYGNYRVYCKIVETFCPSEPDGTCSYGYDIFYAVEVVGQRVGGNESAWLAIGYRLKYTGF